MILHTVFVVDTSLSAAPIFETLVDQVLVPLARGLSARATAGCQFRFSLHTFPAGGQLLADANAAAFEQALGRVELSGGAADGREALAPALAAADFASGDEQLRYALCVVSDAPAFSDAVNGMIKFAAPEALTAVVLLHHPACRAVLLPKSGGMPVLADQSQYMLDDSLPDLVPEIIRRLSDTVLKNSNLR